MRLVYLKNQLGTLDAEKWPDDMPVNEKNRQREIAAEFKITAQEAEWPIMILVKLYPAPASVTAIEPNLNGKSETTA